MNLLSRSRVRRRRSSRRRQLLRIRVIAVSALLFGLCIAGWLIFPDRHNSYYESVASDWSPVPAPAPDYAALAAHIAVPKQASVHHYPVFNYSVVRGGVHSIQDLRQAIAHDHAVAEHYARFQFEHARLVRLDKPALVYLSYRMDGKIFWTKTRHRLTPGEELITDGQIAARTKCANQVSARKQLAVSPEEPPAAALEEVERPLLPPAQTNFPALYKAALTPGNNPPVWTGPVLDPLYPMFGAPVPGPARIIHPRRPACESEWQEKQEAKAGIQDDESKETDCKPRHRPPPAAVPEPGTWLLMGSGLALLAAASRKRKFPLPFTVR